MESDRARLVAKVGAALADRSPEGVAQNLPEAVPLAELMLTCLSLGKASPNLFASICTSFTQMHKANKQHGFLAVCLCKCAICMCCVCSMNCCMAAVEARKPV